VVTKYQKRISGLLLDRIDIHIEVPRMDYEKLSGNRVSESSEWKMDWRIETQVGNFGEIIVFSSLSLPFRIGWRLGGKGQVNTGKATIWIGRSATFPAIWPLTNYTMIRFAPLHRRQSHFQASVFPSS
jgi:hypothetical protein